MRHLISCNKVNVKTISILISGVINPSNFGFILKFTLEFQFDNQYFLQMSLAETFIYAKAIGI